MVIPFALSICAQVKDFGFELRSSSSRISAVWNLLSKRLRRLILYRDVNRVMYDLKQKM